MNYKVANAIKGAIQTHSKLIKLNLSYCNFRWGAVMLIL